jgi:hypothetical protein
MIMLDLLKPILKYISFFAIGLMVYWVYTYIVKPLRKRAYYSKYPNVKMSEKFVPVHGDFNKYLTSFKQGKPYYTHYKHEAHETMNYDMYLFDGLNDDVLKILSHRAKKEMQALIPSKIDRSGLNRSFLKIILNSCISKRSTKDVMGRLKLFTQELSMNSSSKYIPTMIKAVKSVMSRWREGETYQGIKQMNNFTFTAFTMVLFGKATAFDNSTEELVNRMVPYESEENKIIEMPLIDFFY